MPNTAIEEASIWEDRAKSGMTFLFDKITITDVSCEGTTLTLTRTLSSSRTRKSHPHRG
jgi:hypothetical protein